LGDGRAVPVERVVLRHTISTWPYRYYPSPLPFQGIINRAFGTDHWAKGMALRQSAPKDGQAAHDDLRGAVETSMDRTDHATPVRQPLEPRCAAK
jgi:hypothetical protein